VAPRIVGTATCDTGWSVVNSPSYGNSIFLSGSAVTASDIWAAGFNSSGGAGAVDTTLAEHWNGSAWAGVITPNTPLGTGTTSNDLNAIAGVSTGNAWAVGTATFTPSDAAARSASGRPLGPLPRPSRP